MSGNRSVAIFIAAFVFCGVAGLCANLTRAIFPGKDVVRPVLSSIDAVKRKGPVDAAPNISYSTPQSYTVNIAITPLTPFNTGGPVANGPFDKVITMAGSGSAGRANGNGTSSSFNSPHGVAVDNAGNVYVADEVSSIIRKITPDGIVTTLAGSGTAGSSNGMGTAASFHSPFDLAVDPAGNLYVADSKNQKIRKITQAGIVTDFAGNGLTGHDDGQNATFNSPAGIAIDKDGNLYVSDSGNNLIRKITADGTVSTLAGSSSAGQANGTGTSASFNGPIGIAVDAGGNVYVADSYNSLIRKITRAGVVSTFAGSGTAGSADGTGTIASFKDPIGLDIDSYGNLYVTDTQNDKIRKITSQGVVTSIAGKGTPGANNGELSSATFDTPFGIAIDDAGNLYIGDTNNNLVRKITVVKYTIDKQLPPGLIFDTNTGEISGTPTAPLPATDYRITAYNAGGSSTTTLGIEIRNDDAEIFPPKISYVTPQNYIVGQTIATLTPRNNGGPVPQTAYGEVTVLAGNGQKGNADDVGTAAGFNAPASVTTDPSGNIYVADKANNLIRKITPGGATTTFAGNGVAAVVDGQGTAAGFNGPGGIATDAAGNIYVADTEGNVIRKITPGGLVTTIAGTGVAGGDNGPAAEATFTKPLGIATDATGNLYVTEEGSCVIRKISVSGIVSRFAGGNCGIDDGTINTATFSYPQGLAVDRFGNIYVADFGNNRVRKIDAGGKVTTVLKASFFLNFRGLADVTVDDLGNLYASDSGDNEIIKVEADTKSASVLIPVNSGLNLPLGVAVDGNGSLYVANANANNIVKIALTGYQIDRPLPAGLMFDKTTGVISGTPAQAYQITPFTVSAYNAGGKSSFAIEIAVQLQNNTGTIAFGQIPPKIFCDRDFDPGATGTAPITYTSSNESVAKIVGNKVHIVGPGTTTITASDGTSSFSQILTVTPAVVPSLTISPSSADDCEGSTVTYKATPENGGDSPHYQWLVNGQVAGTNSPVFAVNNLTDNDKITCMLTSSACTISTTATSNEAVFVLDPPVTTSVTISSSLNGPVCAGTEITFTAVPALPDLVTVYQWQINGNNVGGNNSAFTTKTLADGDLVTCIMTSQGKCLVTPAVTSNEIAVHFNPVSQCVISIPNTFTPNGDGINDLWNITALAYYPDCALNVYSRYGSLVYKSIGYGTPWDGKSGNRQLPVGTYYYILDLKDGKKPMAGSITILK